MVLNINQNEIISVQVILRPSSNKVINEKSIITSNNIEAYLPPPNAYVLAKRIFSSLGFEVGSLVGISFSISAKVDVFRKILRVSFQRDSKGGILCINKNGSGSLKLPLEYLPEKLIDIIQSITCVEPPDFGPGDF